MDLKLPGGRLNLDTPVTMGILNVTPDSFSDGGRFQDLQSAVDQGLSMCADGAALIDIGGESTRPGAAPVPVEEELRRVLPVIETLAGRTGAVLSVDTSKPEVMRAAVAAGAGMINDVNALRAPGALEAAAGTEAAVCLMHMQGEPRTMQTNPSYNDVVEEVLEFLGSRIEACRAAGISSDRIVVDPGFGFGKSLAHNLQLMRHLGRFRALGTALMVGVSRKSMIDKILDRPLDQRLPGSLALAIFAAGQGANILRVHDVGETMDVLRITAAITGAQPPESGS
ncbi:MAG: dihydropteroate synthase [Gammaproteobacteria bacterium]